MNDYSRHYCIAVIIFPCALTVVFSKRSRMKVSALLFRPMKRLMQDKETYAVLGMLNKYDMGYIMGVTDQLKKSQIKKKKKVS